MPSEAAELEALQRRASLVWEEYRPHLEAHPDAIEVSDSLFRDGSVRAAHEAGVVVGFSAVLPVSDGQWELDGLFVEPARMRRGVGTLLVNDVVARAIAAGIDRITVTANPRALLFYRSLGFTGSARVTTRFGDGVRLQLVVRPTASETGLSAR